MRLSSIFSLSHFQDASLVAVQLYCLLDAQPAPTYILNKADSLELGPCEVLVPYDAMTRDLGLTKDQFLSKIETLVKLHRVSVRLDEDSCRVTSNVQFPIGPVEELRQPDQECYSVHLDRWVQIDLEQIKARQCSIRTLEMVRHALNRFKKEIGNKLLTEITMSDYREYVRILRNGTVSNSSINNYRRVLSASFNRAIDSGFLKKNVIKAEKPLPTSRSKAKIVEPEDLEMLIQFIDSPSIRNVVKFALLSAKRHGEILNLVWEDIDFESGIIKIHSSSHYRTKFNKEQDLPLSDALKKLLEQIQKDQQYDGVESDHVFVDQKGKRLRVKKVQETVKAARVMAELGDHVTLHAMRRTAATMMKRNGASTNTIKGVLNHSDERTTTRYLGVAKEDELNALNTLGLRSFFPEESPSAGGNFEPPNELLTMLSVPSKAAGGESAKIKRKERLLVQEHY